MVEYKMDITKDELDLILKGLSDDGKISKEAEKAILARIKEGKEKEFPMGEVKRQFIEKNVYSAIFGWNIL